MAELTAVSLPVNSRPCERIGCHLHLEVRLHFRELLLRQREIDKHLIERLQGTRRWPTGTICPGFTSRMPAMPSKGARISFLAMIDFMLSTAACR